MLTPDYFGIGQFNENTCYFSPVFYPAGHPSAGLENEIFILVFPRQSLLRLSI